jgi:hypothetical protein
MYFGSSSMPTQTRSVSSAAASVVITFFRMS